MLCSWPFGDWKFPTVAAFSPKMAHRCGIVSIIVSYFFVESASTFCFYTGQSSNFTIDEIERNPMPLSKMSKFSGQKLKTFIPGSSQASQMIARTGTSCTEYDNEPASLVFVLLVAVSPLPHPSFVVIE